MGPLPDLRGAFIFLFLIGGVVGWALIEFILWVVSHIVINWVG